MEQHKDVFGLKLVWQKSFFEELWAVTLQLKSPKMCILRRDYLDPHPFLKCLYIYNFLNNPKAWGSPKCDCSIWYVSPMTTENWLEFLSRWIRPVFGDHSDLWFHSGYHACITHLPCMQKVLCSRTTST